MKIVKKFVKKYANAFEIISQAVKEYVSDVKEQKFPADSNAFNISHEEFALFKEKMRGNQILDELLHKASPTEEKSDLISRIYGN